MRKEAISKTEQKMRDHFVNVQKQVAEQLVKKNLDYFTMTPSQLSRQGKPLQLGAQLSPKPNHALLRQLSGLQLNHLSLRQTPGGGPGGISGKSG